MTVGFFPNLSARRAKAEAKHGCAPRKKEAQQECHNATQGPVDHIETGEVPRVNQKQPFAQPDQLGLRAGL